MIDVKQLTLQYPNGKGIEDVTFSVKEGEVLGYLGPNGAGKTTTIRCLLGFSTPGRGSCHIADLDCRKKAPEIQRFLGYIPGEIAFLNGMTGKGFLQFLADMRGTRDKSRMQELADLFEIDLKGKIKRYSKGMKQKIGIIAAFMHDPAVLILDEPTSGLDPIMQKTFIDLLLREKNRGKTMLLSSHLFEEVEKTCDQIIIIKEGRLIKQTNVALLKQTQRISYVIHLAHPEDVVRLKPFGADPAAFSDGRGEIVVRGEQLNAFLACLASLSVLSLETKAQSLEEIFLNLYG